jgi:subtilisin family serine protease
MARRPAALVVALLLLFAQIATATTTTAPPGAGDDPPAVSALEPGLADKLRTGELDTFVVEFGARADLKPATKIKDHDKRGQFVLTSLRATAAASQKEAKAVVNATKRAKGTSYWLTNVMVVRGDAKLAAKLAKTPGVSAVRAPRTYPLVEPVETRAAILAAAGDPEWGVAKIRADEAWAMGVTGSGVVVANVDTGVDYQHPALVNQYRGNLGDGAFDHNYNWWDPTGICGSEPCDNVFHGTHTMGTIVGGDGPGPFTPDIGVAPGARWIAAKGCEENWCTEESLLSAGQFVVAPTDLAGLNPDPAQRPDIVNNSWGGGPGDPFYLETVQVWRAAGIIPVFSSGNPGPFCGEGGSPGDFLESFSVGATDVDDQIADFSGRGPSVYGKVNPDVSAPGVNVSSSMPGGGYEAFDGTSMAAPHVTGTFALMLSAEPALRSNIVAAMDAVRTAAVDRIDAQCGGDEDGDPNNVYGDGRIDAFAAVDLVANGGTLAGTVTDGGTAAPIPGARIAASDGARTWNAVTDADGRYELFLAAGTYLVGVEAFGYFSTSIQDVAIVKDTTTTQDVALTAKPRFTVSGTIRAAEDGSPIESAAVRAMGTPVPAAISDASGEYELVLPIGEYVLRSSAGGCTEAVEATVNLTDADVTQDFALARKLDAFGHGCRAIPFDWVDADVQSALFGDEFAGRLRLPFDVTFYDDTYRQVFLSDNGYLNFLAPDQWNMEPSGIPSKDAPNAAIYALWENLHLDGESSIDYSVAGAPGTRMFTIQYSGVRAVGSQARLDFQVRLHEAPERIDLLFGANAANPGDGRNATIGIENATGSDALQFGFREGVVEPRSAFRFEMVPSGWLKGTVTDQNDGLPIPGATVRVTPGIHVATTQADGTYELRLMPGSYTAAVTARGHSPADASFTIADKATTVLDFVLAAPLPSMTPAAVDATVDVGQSATRTVTIANDGTAPLDWELLERDTGFTPAPIGMGNGTDRGLDSRSAPRGYVATRVQDTTPGGGGAALLVMDDLPWGSDAIQTVLEANGISYDMAGSDALASIDLAGYKLVIVANDQSQGFYESLKSSMDRLEAYARAGGFLFFGAASGGWNGGDFSGATLPGGAVVGEWVFDDFNDIAAPDHPVMAGLPDPFSGTSASHTVFAAVPADTTVIATSSITGEPTLIEYRLGAGQLLAFAQPMEFGFVADQDTGRILVNAIPYAWSFAADAPWLSSSPSTGTLAPGEQAQVELTLGTPDLAPGAYTAQVFLDGNFAKPSPPPTTDVALTVSLPESFGQISGTVADAHDGSPIGGAAVVLHAAWPPGTPRDFATVSGGDGTWSLVVPEGTWPLETTLDGYLAVTRDVTVTRGTTTDGIDVALHRIKPHAVIEAGELSWTVPEGVTRQATVTVSNPEGHVPLTFETHEVNIAAPGSGVAGVTTVRTPPAGAAANARTTRGLFPGAARPAVPAGLMMEGDVLASWPAVGIDLPWGVGSTGADVWISDPDEGGEACGDRGACLDAVYTASGDLQRTVDTPWASAWPADMAFGRGLIWQLNVGGDNGIYGLDPSDGTVVTTITGSPWSGISQRGLAYDPAEDVFYVGGWNEGIVYRVAGPTHATPGETLNQCSPADQAIAGLAWNPAFGLLWQATNSESDTVYLLDPATCETVRALPHPDPGYNAGGLELDPAGNLWMISMGSGTVYLVESGLPNYSDAPWLTVSPASGTVAPDESAAVDVTIDTTGLAPGIYRAAVVITTNDEDSSLALLPVTLTVPAYLQGINAGGAAFTDTNTDQTAYAADRAYAPGAFGWVGTSSTRSTRTAIDGTDADALYQDLRTGMTAYRFDVPDGHYQVVLRFAELTAKKAGARVFSVGIEGATVASNLDLFAAAGGRFVAYDLVFETDVSDGVLDIGFGAQRGDAPIVNAILVTEMPAGG